MCSDICYDPSDGGVQSSSCNASVLLFFLRGRQKNLVKCVVKRHPTLSPFGFEWACVGVCVMSTDRTVSPDALPARLPVLLLWPFNENKLSWVAVAFCSKWPQVSKNVMYPNRRKINSSTTIIFSFNFLPEAERMTVLCVYVCTHMNIKTMTQQCWPHFFFFLNGRCCTREWGIQYLCGFQANN